MDAKALQGALRREYSQSSRQSIASEHDLSLEKPETEDGKRSAAPKEARVEPPNITLPVTFGSIVANLLGLAMPLVILQVYDRIIPNQSVATFTLLVLGLTTALCLEAAMRTARAWLSGWSVVGYEVSLARQNMEHLLQLPSDTVSSEPESEFLSRLSAIDMLRQFYGGQSRLLLIDLPFVFLFLGLIWTIAGPLVFVPFFLLGAFGALTIRHGAALRRLLARRALHDSNRQDFAIHTLSDLGAIKSQVGEGFFHRRHDRHSRTGAVINYETVVLGGEAHSLSAVFSNAAIVSVVSFGAYYVIAGQLSIGALAAVTLLTGRTMQPLVRALGLWSQIQSLQIAKSRVQELLDLSADRHDQAKAGLTGAISLMTGATAKDDSVQSGAAPVEMDIQTGQLVVIRCLDGLAARELAEKIAGETKPADGAIWAELDDGTRVSPSEVRGQVGFVSDPAPYFDGSLLHNLSMFRTGPAFDRALEAAGQIGLTDYVEQLPDGFDTQVVSGVTSQLPAGLLQLTALARVLAQQHKVLVLLDPLARLDRRSQRNVLNALVGLKGNATAIVFSHHSAFERIADQVLDLKAGKLRKARLRKKTEPQAPSVKVGEGGRVANG